LNIKDIEGILTVGGVKEEGDKDEIYEREE